MLVYLNDCKLLSFLLKCWFVICKYSLMCSVSVHSTHLWCTAWKVFCSCAQYTFMMYRLESVLFLCTVHIYDVPPGKCSVPVHSTHFWRTVWKVFCFRAQYTFLTYRLESVLFLCTVHISDVPCGKCSCAQYILLMCRLESVLFLCTVHILDAQCCYISFRNLLPCTEAKVFVLLGLLRCDFTVEKTVPITVETCNRNSFPYAHDRYEIFVLHPQ